MRIRSTKQRLEELKSWLLKNKKGTLQEFSRVTGGTSHQYYYLRAAMNIPANNQTIAKAISRVAKKRHAEMKAAPVSQEKIETARKDMEEYLAGPTPPVPQVVVEGTTPDFIWYEMDLMQRKLSDVSVRLNHVMKVTQARDSDQKKMMRDLISENSTLRVENNGLRQQVAELSEMINGAPV